MTAWTEKIVTDPEPATVRKLSLTLDGGLRISTDDQFHGRMVYINLPQSVTKFPWDTPIDDIAAQLPARLLPVLRAAVTDLERMVTT